MDRTLVCDYTSLYRYYSTLGRQGLVPGAFKMAQVNTRRTLASEHSRTPRLLPNGCVREFQILNSRCSIRHSGARHINFSLSLSLSFCLSLFLSFSLSLSLSLSLSPLSLFLSLSLSLSLSLCLSLPVEWRSSRSKNSATRTTIHKRINACESPFLRAFTSGLMRVKVLSYAQIFTSKIDVAASCRAFEFLEW